MAITAIGTAGQSLGVIANSGDQAAFNGSQAVERIESCLVTVRLLPRRLGLEAGGELGIIDEVIEEAVPGLGGAACISEHVA